ncbi:MAG: GtrA family protein [Candidatus Merdivicinus sp.]|jgi:putative flippase GtrA
MIEKIRELLVKYRELIAYLVFGVLTTIVNYVVYLLAAPLFETTTIPTAIAWVFAVIFAYLTNRRYVFHSKVTGTAALAREILTFFGARALSGVLDVGFMWVFADRLGFNDKIMKLVSNVFVVIFNYIASKLVIFRKK